MRKGSWEKSCAKYKMRPSEQGSSSIYSDTPLGKKEAKTYRSQLFQSVQIRKHPAAKIRIRTARALCRDTNETIEATIAEKEEARIAAILKEFAWKETP